MDRKTLETEVIRRLRTRSCDIPVLERAIKLKPTDELEDILRRMKDDRGN